jgi:anti-sigma-K factor RskA
MLPYSAPEASPQPALREQLIAAVAREVDEAAPAPRPAPVARSAPAPRPRSRLSFWAALAFASLALALLSWNFSLQRQLNEQTAIVNLSRQNWQTMIVLLDDKQLARYAVAADPAPPSGQYPAHGHFWASPQAQVACLVAQGLPDLSGDQVYQIWLVRGNEQSSGGTFEAHSGKGWTLVSVDEPIADYSAMFVTVEPAGGSAAPDGPRVMSATLTGAAATSWADRQELIGLLPRAD